MRRWGSGRATVSSVRFCTCLLLVSLTWLCAGIVVAQDAPAGSSPTRPSVIARPETPEADDPMRYYPEAAQKLGIPGRVVIDCLVLADDHLGDCKIVQETPAGMGFGDTALKMSALFKMRPLTKDGTPSAGGRVTIPVKFTLPPEDRQPPE